MSKLDRMGTLPPLEIGQGRRTQPAPKPANQSAEKQVAPAQKEAAPAKPTKKPASEVVSSLKFAPKGKDGSQASFYLRKDILAKIEVAVKDSGAPSRSVWLETLLDQVL
jgi:hypothetical protein